MSQDEPVSICNYDPAWPARFAAEQALLERVLADWLAGPIEHVGSTAVPGLAAKPVIDIMAAVRDLESVRDAIPVLAERDYCHAPYKSEVMHWFCKPSPERRTHHLHLVPYESRLWHERLVFRDALRADAVLAAEYAALKRELAVRFSRDRERYTQEKGSFIVRVLAGSSLQGG